ncbi:mannitol dehydrogenase [Catellatospora sp. TT07R-123]|uniref:mannitol dehydrogenase family protein n=1 Tax=Catellatospora sp. TT07R-123 TaxID=2733863 RepID=UPI001B2AC8C0|nr:mannitol dehydrogenase family protein [Catellatospora sp. TT07R-123]GHJ44333.1 mannitol dehydrogenase [Catellatospora sp. TT07R-123]
MSARLGRAALARLPEHARPLIEPGAARTGVVHFGLGAFHRAHQAVYTELAMARGGGDWAVTAIAPSSRTVLDALRAQDHLFSVVTLSADQAGAVQRPHHMRCDDTTGGVDAARTRVVGAIADSVLAAEDPQAVVALLADPGVRVVTLTVTEKAYRAEAAVPRLLIAGLAARARADAGPITLLSCDNLPSNGRTLDRLLSGMLPGDLRDWYADSVTCPSSMVDRIVPATTAQTLGLARADLGVDDLAAVAAEPFSQWVIEDRFAAGRPDWAAAGAVFTDDVTAWEHLKLRALNGVHSALAYLGALAGCEAIADALALPGAAALLRRYVATEVAASMTPPPGVDVTAYGDQARERFANHALGHRCLQVAMDGTQKLPQRVLPMLAAPDPNLTCLILAAWARFAEGTADDGTPLPLNDPLAATVRADLTTEALFGPGGVLPVPDPAHRKLIDSWRTALARHGAAALLAAEAR